MKDFSKATDRYLSVISLYEVTEAGEVFSKTNWRGYGRRAMRQDPDKDGYLYVKLTIDGIRRCYLVHRLVIIKYKGVKPFGIQVRHLDGNKLNNSITNLAYGSAKENAEDRDNHGTTAKHERNGVSKLTPNAVRNIRRKATQGYTRAQLGVMYSVSPQNITSIVNNKTWKNL